jgi:hypothetical protein
MPENYSDVTPAPPGAENAEHSLSDSLDSSGPRRSWSQFNQWRQCGKAWELAKIRRVPKRPGVWNPAGTAVHATIEQYLRARLAEGSNHAH